jgi:hypothetical protein
VRPWRIEKPEDFSVNGRAVLDYSVVVFFALCMLLAASDIRVRSKRVGGIQFLRIGGASISFCWSKKRG